MKKYLFGLMLIALAFSGCCRKVNSPLLVTQEREVTLEKKDTLIQIPESRATVFIPIQVSEDCPPAITDTVVSYSRSSLSLRWDSLGLWAECLCDTAAIAATLNHKTIKETNTIFKEVPYTPWYNKALMWVGIAALCYLLVKKILL